MGQDSVICQLPHTWSPVPVTTLFPLCLPSATLPFSEVCTYSLQLFLFCFSSLVVGRGRSKESCEQFLISQHSDSPRKQRLRDASSALPPSPSFAQFLQLQDLAQFLQQQKTLHNSSNNKKIFAEFPLTTIILHNSIIFIGHGNLGY